MSRFETDVFGKNELCYVAANYPDAKAVIDAIHIVLEVLRFYQAGIQIIFQMMFQKKLWDLGMDGVECFSNDIHEQTVAAALKIVQKRKLFVSCSDYHGPTKPKYHIWCFQIVLKKLYHW